MHSRRNHARTGSDGDVKKLKAFLESGGVLWAQGDNAVKWGGSKRSWPKTSGAFWWGTQRLLSNAIFFGDLLEEPDSIVVKLC